MAGESVTVAPDLSPAAEIVDKVNEEVAAPLSKPVENKEDKPLKTSLSEEIKKDDGAPETETKVEPVVQEPAVEPKVDPTVESSVETVKGVEEKVEPVEEKPVTETIEKLSEEASMVDASDESLVEKKEDNSLVEEFKKDDDVPKPLTETEPKVEEPKVEPVEVRPAVEAVEKLSEEASKVDATAESSVETTGKVEEKPTTDTIEKLSEEAPMVDASDESLAEVVEKLPEEASKVEATDESSVEDVKKEEEKAEAAVELPKEETQVAEIEKSFEEPQKVGCTTNGLAEAVDEQKNEEPKLEKTETPKVDATTEPLVAAVEKIEAPKVDATTEELVQHVEKKEEQVDPIEEQPKEKIEKLHEEAPKVEAAVEPLVETVEKETAGTVSEEVEQVEKEPIETAEKVSEPTIKDLVETEENNVKTEVLDKPKVEEVIDTITPNEAVNKTLEEETKSRDVDSEDLKTKVVDPVTVEENGKGDGTAAKEAVEEAEKPKPEEKVQDNVETGETKTKEISVKKSSGIMAKVKHSLVKAKKAITGKSPNPKSISTETKGEPTEK